MLMRQTNERTDMNNERRAHYGRVAVLVGDSDGNYDTDKRTAYVDALANIRHAARADGIDFFDALSLASLHFGAEIEEENSSE